MHRHAHRIRQHRAPDADRARAAVAAAKGNRAPVALVALFATLLGAIFFMIGHMAGLSLWANVVFAIGIIVANVPEGLLPTVTLSLAMATQRMAKKNALVRHLPRWKHSVRPA